MERKQQDTGQENDMFTSRGCWISKNKCYFTFRKKWSLQLHSVIRELYGVHPNMGGDISPGDKHRISNFRKTVTSIAHSFMSFAQTLRIATLPTPNNPGVIPLPHRTGSVLSSSLDLPQPIFKKKSGVLIYKRNCEGFNNCRLWCRSNNCGGCLILRCCRICCLCDIMLLHQWVSPCTSRPCNDTIQT